MLIHFWIIILKILIIRLSSIGDIFHTFTLLPDIKQKYPDAEIDWLVDENFKGIAEVSPLINKVISIPLRKWKKNKLSWVFKLIKFKQTLNQEKYDYIIDTQGLIKSAFLAKFLFNGKIYGLDRKSARESLASWFYDYKYNVSQKNVAVIRLRGLIGKIFNLKHDLYLINFKVKSVCCNIDYSEGYLLYLHGTSKENKKWSLEAWCKFSEWIINNTQLKIILTYSNQTELEFTQKFAEQMMNDRIIIIEKLNFLELVDLVQNAKLVVGVDTGFTHLANLLNKPTLAIYLHSDPNYVGMLESTIAHNFGGYKAQVDPNILIDYIKTNNLLELNNVK